jgi:nitric oxide reductase large subunit
MTLTQLLLPISSKIFFPTMMFSDIFGNGCWHHYYFFGGAVSSMLQCCALSAHRAFPAADGKCLEMEMDYV